MTKKTILELAKILDDYAELVNAKFNKGLNRITPYGDARERYRGKIAADGMLSLLNKRDQARLKSTMKQYLIAAKQRDAEIDEIINKLNKIIGDK